jgi:hypothetical protein
LALVRLLPQRGALTLVVLAIATSLTLETLVAEAMLETSAWSPRATLALLIAVTMGGSVIQLRTALERDGDFGVSGARVFGSRSP